MGSRLGNRLAFQLGRGGFEDLHGFGVATPPFVQICVAHAAVGRYGRRGGLRHGDLANPGCNLAACGLSRLRQWLDPRRAWGRSLRTRGIANALDDALDYGNEQQQQRTSEGELQEDQQQAFGRRIDLPTGTGALPTALPGWHDEPLGGIGGETAPRAHGPGASRR